MNDIARIFLNKMAAGRKNVPKQALPADWWRAGMHALSQNSVEA